MGLLDEIGAQTKSRHRPCIVTEILDDLPIEDARELQLALDDAAMTHTAITRVLVNRGYPVAPNGKQVANHRHGSCQCRA